jgi:hypothetical protein
MEATYKCKSAELGFVNDMVSRFLINELPGADFEKDENLVDKISDLFLGTRNIRLAGNPSPESQVLMRTVIRTAMAQGKPIPVLSAAGPKKSNSGQIDLAEFSAMQKLVCLQERVAKYYAPGMSFRIRLEDTTGAFLEPIDSAYEMDQYCKDFIKLCALLEERVGGKFLTAWRESSNMEQSGKMLELAHQNVSVFELAFAIGDQEGVKAAGWQSGVGQDWKDFLNERYSKLFPLWTQEQKDHQAAKYLASTLARHLTGMTGATPDWDIDGRHLEISFATPAPGSPKASTRVYYRTMSTKQTKTHMPYWRSKGYFRLVDGALKMGLARCGDNPDYVPGKLTLTSTDGLTRLGVAADFLNQ